MARLGCSYLIFICTLTLLTRSSSFDFFSQPSFPLAIAVNMKAATVTAPSDRRAALVGICIGATAIVLGPRDVQASGDNQDDGGAPSFYLAQPLGASGEVSSRPSAPLEYLLPASRVGLYIYQALAIAEEIAKLQSSENADSEKVKTDVAKLDGLLLSPPSFIKRADPDVSRGDPYNSPPIVGEIGAAARKQKERRDRSIDVGFAPQFFEVGELVGERRQWNQLQKAERAREAASEVRKAFNIYTTNLNFNRNKYEWIGSKDEKSKRIRDDKLPTANDVIRSDLDARDLYRNQVQTALEDARAEYLYQQKAGEFDAAELLSLLQQAQIAVDKWFSFIPDIDVKNALEAVRAEQ